MKVKSGKSGLLLLAVLLISLTAAAQDKFKPEIAGPYRVLFKPVMSGDAINDHTVFQDAAGNWRMIGIVSRGNGLVETLVTPAFAHAVGNSLSQEMKELPVIFGDYPDQKPKWAPHVIEHAGVYHLYAGPGKIRHYTSPDGIVWTFQAYVIERPFANLRDTMVIKIGQGLWLMYAADSQNTVSVFESSDLDHWTWKGTAFKAIKPAPVYPKWLDISACESPFEIFYQGYYYLSVCLTNSRRDNYSNTVIVRSRDPYSFGIYAGVPQAGVGHACPAPQGQSADYVTTLSAHAAEYIKDPDGNWWITSCGWRGRKTPEGFEPGTLSIARLRWEKQ